MTQADRLKWNAIYRSRADAGRAHPTALLEEWLDRIPRGRALDVACGGGRNALFLAAQGFEVDAVDISGEALDRARSQAHGLGERINWIEHDLDEPLILEAQYALILVVRYVNLPLIQTLIGNLAPGGFLLCEQHLVTDAEVIGPSNPAYRVKPGTLRNLAKDLDIRFYDEAIIEEADGRQAALARLLAQNP